MGVMTIRHACAVDQIVTLQSDCMNNKNWLSLRLQSLETKTKVITQHLSWLRLSQEKNELR